MPDSLVLAVDIGGTNTKLGLVSPSGELIERSITTTPQRRDMPDVVATIVRAAEPLLSRASAQITGIGVAAPGVVDLAGEHVTHAPNFPTWNHEPLRSAVEHALNRPTVLGNDVDLFGLAEHRWGAARGFRHFIAVAVGTGVGGAIFVDGKLYRGADGGAAELGFTIISPNGPAVLDCPGVLEAYVGRRGFDEMVMRLFPSGEFPTPRRITELAAAGDPRARQIHAEIARYLSEAAASWLHILNPEALVLGGGTLAGATFFFEEFERCLRRRARATHTQNLKILPGQLGYYAGVQGAAALWLESHADG
jgi:glucokinase